MCCARKRSRRGSGKAQRSVSWTKIVPAVGTETPAMRLRSVVLPEPLGPVMTVHPPAGSAHSPIFSASRALPLPSGNDFFTPRRVTASRVCVIAPSRGTRRAERHAVRPVLGQLVQINDLDDVGPPVPDEIGMQGQREKAEGLSRVFRVHG